MQRTPSGWANEKEMKTSCEIAARRLFSSALGRLLRLVHSLSGSLRCCVRALPAQHPISRASDERRAAQREAKVARDAQFTAAERNGPAEFQVENKRGETKR